MEQFRGVQGKANVARIAAALEQCGATIVQNANPTVAPFEFVVRSPNGELVDLVCYAFTANEYKQKGRPPGEHRFQLKYGSEFDRYHDIFVDAERRRVTLMFGVHDELDLFVCVDPAMHNPTWFSISIEFKDAELQSALASGWHGWERERSAVRRKREMPSDDLRTEAVCAFRPEFFLRYVAFERLATGSDTGERLLLWDKLGRGLHEPRQLDSRAIGHPLEDLLSLPASDILDVVQEHFRLLVALRGSVAEHHLGSLLRATNGITRVRPLDEDGQPDFVVEFGGRDVRIECKNTLRRLSGNGHPRVDFQKTRASKGDPCSRFYSPEQFEILAACLHPVTEKWEYAFFPTSRLQPHPRCGGRLSSNVVVSDWPRKLADALAGF